MPVTSIHSNIKEELIKHLSSARISIKAAIAWFTDGDLFEILCERSLKDCLVQIIIHDDFNDSGSVNFSPLGLNFSKLIYAGGEVNILKGMHNKYCIIDGQISISGSYNWTWGASHKKQGFENIYINTERDNIQKDEKAFKMLYEQSSPLLSLVKKYELPKIDLNNCAVAKIIPLGNGIYQLLLYETNGKYMPFKIHFSTNIFNFGTSEEPCNRPDRIMVSRSDNGELLLKPGLTLTLFEGILWLTKAPIMEKEIRYDGVERLLKRHFGKNV